MLRETEPPIHVSGHAHADDIAEWLRMLKPRAVVPIHGEIRMLAAAAQVARDAGVAADRVPLLDNGDRVVLSAERLRVERGAVATGKIFLDSRPEAVELDIVRDRRRLAEEGFIVVFVHDREIAVVSRGVAPRSGTGARWAGPAHVRHSEGPGQGSAEPRQHGQDHRRLGVRARASKQHRR